LKKYLHIIFIIATTQIVFGQPKPLQLSNINSSHLSEEPGLRSNIINCIALQGDRTTWIGTGQGISVMHDSLSIFTLDTMHLVDEEPRFLFDSVASIAVQDDVVAFAASSSENGISLGTGIYVIKDGLSAQIEWYRFNQPVDEIGDSLTVIGDGYFKARPVIKALTNVTYDMDISGNYLWIVSWAGGLRRLDLTEMENWERILFMDCQLGRRITAFGFNRNGKLGAYSVTIG
jgi:hypothetical protein